MYTTQHPYIKSSAQPTKPRMPPVIVAVSLIARRLRRRGTYQLRTACHQEEETESENDIPKLPTVIVPET